METFKKLYSKTLKVSALSKIETDLMFLVFSKYYSNVSLEKFLADLSLKDVVFLLIDKKTKIIKGFSTLVKLEQEGVVAFFSGDTVVEKEYWGQSKLQNAFGRYLIAQKFINPGKKVYWFLISKGFKTYLLMANNFENYWPGPEQTFNAPLQSILNNFSIKLFGDSYDSSRGVLSYKNIAKDHLKDFVAPITPSMIKGNSKIAFFVEKNPFWQDGEELCCIAEMKYITVMKYQLKSLKKNILRNFTKKKSSASTEVRESSLY